MNKVIRLIGVPMDLGQNQRGVDMGPSAIRYAGLAGAIRRLGYEVRDSGDLPVPQRHAIAGLNTDSLYQAIQQGCELVYKAACEAVHNGESPIFLGGDHTMSIGSISGLTCRESLGVIWIDAHGDCNTPDTSPSGNIHGMVLAMLLGHGPVELVFVGDRSPKILPENVVLIGVRSLDEGEKKLLKQLGIQVFTMRDIDERGMGRVMQESVHHLSHCDKLHVSLDMDCLDPKDAPGVGTQIPGGITYREAQLAMEIMADTRRCFSMDIAEINPILDHENKTGRIAVALMESLLGKTIF